MSDISDFNFDELFTLIAEKGESLFTVARQLTGDRRKANKIAAMVHNTPHLMKKFDTARRVVVERHVDELLEIADEPFDTGSKTEMEHRKMRIKVRQYRLEKVLPELYGSKIDIKHLGDQDKPLVHKIERVIVDPKKEDQNISFL